MPGFKNKRIGLLVLALLLSGLFITSPWKEPQPEGAPLPNIIRGPNWGVDITGGTRIMLHLKATRASVKFPENIENHLNYGQDVLQRFEENLEPPVRRLSAWETVSNTGELIIEIGEYVDENLITSLLRNGESLAGPLKQTVFSQTQEKVKNSLKIRVDPYGTLGALFKPMGEKNQFLQFEVSLPKEEAKRLLGKEGLPEVFIDNKRTIWSKHIKNVTTRLGDRGWEVRFSLSEEGQSRFADYTGRKEGIENKTGHAGVIYLDRPTDSVLLFTQEFEDNVQDQASLLLGDKELQGYSSTGEAGYSETAQKFWFRPADQTETENFRENFRFYIQVPAAKIEENEVPENSATFIKSLKQQGEITQGILIGEKKAFSENLIQDGKLIINGQPVLPVENVGRREVGGQAGKELAINLLTRVCGVESWPTLLPSVVGTPSKHLTITTGTGQSGKDEAEDLRVVLSQRLPVKVEHVSEKEIHARLSQAFLKEVAIAGGAAFLLVGILVYFFFRRFKIAIPLLLTMASEVIITLGASSAIPDGLMSIGLPGIGGLIAVVGTGVDHQIIITDEVIGKKFSTSGKLPIDRRTGRAFSIILAAAATTIAAMFALAVFGFGRMRGFAIVTLLGVLVSVLITRPAYAKIIGTLLEREQKEKGGGS